MLTKKQDIIETATRLFAYQGFEGTSTRQLVKEADVSDPLLYYHFKSKDDLYIQIVDSTFKKYICSRNIKKQRTVLAAYLTDCLKTGIETGEFTKVPVRGTVNLFIGMINGLLRQRAFKLENLKHMKEITVDFCRRSLIQ